MKASKPCENPLLGSGEVRGYRLSVEICGEGIVSGGEQFIRDPVPEHELCYVA
jgi:hypothetical protein